MDIRNELPGRSLDLSNERQRGRARRARHTADQPIFMLPRRLSLGSGSLAGAG